MKLVFEGIEDMLVDLPRFMRLMAGEGSLSERITFSLGEKAAKAIAERMNAQDPAPVADPAPAAAPEAKTKKNTSKKAKPAEPATEPVSEAPTEEDKPMNEPEPEEAPKVTETQVKQALSGLMKSRKDAVKKILHDHGAANLTKLAAEHYADVLEQAKKYKAMSDGEYKEAMTE